MPKNVEMLPVALAVGEDALKRERVEERLIARLSQMGDLSFNSEVFDGASADGAAIVTACNTLPFASAYRLVTVRNADKLKAADARAVADYLASPCPTTVLALFAAKLSKSSRLYKAAAAFGKGAVIDCAAVKEKELPALVAGMAGTRGLKMTRAAVDELLERVGEDTVRLDSELRKLALAHSGSDPVTDGEVALAVGRTTEVPIWEFVDAFSSRNLMRCLRCLEHMPSATPYALIGRCEQRLREIIVAKASAARHQPGRLADDLIAVGLPRTSAGRPTACTPSGRVPTRQPSCGMPWWGPVTRNGR